VPEHCLHPQPASVRRIGSEVWYTSTGVRLEPARVCRTRETTGGLTTGVLTASIVAEDRKGKPARCQRSHHQ
jgi:hypothetical protein